MQTAERRYDIDWLRVIAIALLVFFHIALIFQPWGNFIQSEETSETLHILIAVFYVWRIPLLFLISGMGVCFALRRRDWKELLKDRAVRILLPLVFGTFCIVPIHEYIYQIYYDQELAYSPSMGHLWFLANICIYVTMVIGFAFLNQNYDYKFFNFIRDQLKRAYLLYLFIIPIILEVEITNPEYYSIYIGNAHGFLIGMLSFMLGFIFIAIGDSFWSAVEKIKFTSIIIAVALYLLRVFYFEYKAPNYLSAIESMNWIFAILGFGYKYLNKPGKILSYLSQSAYPVYIIHMIFLYLAAFFILPLNLPLGINFLLIILLTFIGCFVTYEIFIRRIEIIRPLLGLKRKSNH